MDHPYRDWVRNKLADIIGAGPTARNCERNILNWTVKTCSGAASFDKKHFRQMYKMKTMFLLASMKRCPEIIEKLKTKQLESSKIAFYSSDILEPDGPYSAALLANRKKDMEMEARKCEDEDYEGILKCGKCKSNKTDYYQMQTRSADEPMVRYSVFNTLYYSHSFSRLHMQTARLAVTGGSFDAHLRMVYISLLKCNR
jgi:DNA-directed RNA polymerase subunit M/transcription elongation factor TFIIS